MAYSILEDISQFHEQMFLYSMGILAAEDIVTIDRGGKLVGRGEFMTLPKINETSTPVRRDYSTTGQSRSFAEMSTTTEKGVVCRDDVADQFLEAQTDISGADFQRFWMARVGLHHARRAKLQLYRVAKAAVEAMQTSDGSTASVDCHISDAYSPTANNVMSFARLQAAKMKMGDAAGLLTHAVMHSDCWNQLILSGLSQSQFSIDSVAGMIIQKGNFSDAGMRQLIREGVTMRIARCQALGLVILIDDDIGTIDMTGSTYTYKDKYETLLFGPGALLLSYQRFPAPNIERYLGDARGSVIRMRHEFDYVAHLNGMKWNSATANPSDAALGTKSNWSESYSNHKEVRCVKLITN